MTAVGLSVLREDAWRRATVELFEEGLVEALSLSFEGLGTDPPEWMTALLDWCASEGRLTLHGVAMSPLSVRPDPAQRAAWLARAKEVTTRWPCVRVSEHFGFSVVGDVLFGAPMPLPPTDAAIATGRAALDALAEATGLAPGIENLALAMTADDARAHGAFLRELVSHRDDAHVLLDVHNLDCQAENFGLDACALLDAYPLERVREVHVAGGRTSTPRGATRPFRRDTHDCAIPGSTLALLGEVLARAPAIELVIVERIGGTLDDEAEARAFASDYRAVVRIVGAAAPPPTHVLVTHARVPLETIHDTTETLDRLERAMLDGLTREADVEALRAKWLADEALAHYHAWLSAADVRALDTARELVVRWARRTSDGAG